MAPRPFRNREDASDLVAALMSTTGALRNEASRLSGDVSRLYGKIEPMHRAADRLHREIGNTRARNSDYSILRLATSSQTEPVCAGQPIESLLVESN